MRQHLVCRWSSILLAAALLWSLAGCGSRQEVPAPSDSSEEPEVTAQEEEVPEQTPEEPAAGEETAEEEETVPEPDTEPALSTQTETAGQDGEEDLLEQVWQGFQKVAAEFSVPDGTYGGIVIRDYDGNGLPEMITVASGVLNFYWYEDDQVNVVADLRDYAYDAESGILYLTTLEDGEYVVNQYLLRNGHLHSLGVYPEAVDGMDLPLYPTLQEAWQAWEDQPDSEAETASQDLSDEVWNVLACYQQAIQEKEAESGPYWNYALLYLNGDEIPELYAIGDSVAAGADLFYYEMGEVHTQHLEVAALKYAQGTGFAMMQGYHQEYEMLAFYSYVDGQGIVLDGEGYCIQRDFTYATPLEDPTAQCFWNEEEIPREDFVQQVEQKMGAVSEFTPYETYPSYGEAIAAILP